MNKIYIKYLLGLLFLSSLLLSCARVGSPVGGDKDTIPPKPIAINIDSPFVKVPRDFRTLRIKFDEYITLKDINKNLIISPPIKNITRIIPSNIATKEIIIEWKDTLQNNTTYSFNFGNAIRDNNEDNPLLYYNIAFSTGEKIDDTYISGYVTDGYSIKNNKNKKPQIVGLYAYKDTIDYTKKPLYITKVDDDGYYEINYLSKGKYKIIAFQDENENSIYDTGQEKIAFTKDTLVLNASKSKVNLKLYPSKKIVKYIETKEIPGGAMLSFEGNPKKINIKPENEELKIKTYHKPYSDSLYVFWDTQNAQYNKNTSQNIAFEYSINDKKGKANLFFRNTTPPNITITGENTITPKNNFILKSNMPIDSIDTSRWVLKQDSINTIPFKVVIDEKNTTKIAVSADFLEGEKYILTVPKNSVKSYFTKNDKTYQWEFVVDKINQYGSFLLKLKPVNDTQTKRWIQLLDGNDKVIKEKYTSDTDIFFPILKPDEYNLRILVDENNDGFWEPANLQNDALPEAAYIYHKKIIVRPLWELVEEWELER